jgi:TRAP-type uncharacterized transport system fused permease subunit
MPTRKQRRRREKELRHDYVWQDAEGNEVDPAEVRPQRNGSDTKATRPAARERAGGGGGGRQIQPPSWRRTFKRGLIFAPIFLVVVMLLNRQLTLAGAALNTAFLLAVFVPFSYLIDRFMYRSFQKRSERAGGQQPSGKR